MNKTILTLTAAVLISGSIAAYAKECPDGDQSPECTVQQQRAAFAKAQDKARAKMKEDLRRQFSAMDANQDGKVTKEEFVTYRLKNLEKQQAEIFNKIDADGKGSFTEEEYLSSVNNLLKDIASQIANTIKKNM